MIQRVYSYSSGSYPTSISAITLAPYFTGVPGTCMFVFFKTRLLTSSNHKKISSLRLGYFPDSVNASLLGEIASFHEAGCSTLQAWVFPDLTSFVFTPRLQIDYTGSDEGALSLYVAILHGAQYSSYAQHYPETEIYRFDPTLTFSIRGGYAIGQGTTLRESASMVFSGYNGAVSVSAPSYTSDIAYGKFHKLRVGTLSEKSGLQWDPSYMSLGVFQAMGFSPIERQIAVPLWALGGI